jgi:hypothetical protein
MQKKSIIWTAVATTAAVVAIYYIRKRNSTSRTAQPATRSRHLTQAFTRAKGAASGEYTL